MDKLSKLLEKANSRLKTSNSGIKIFKRGQKLSPRGMLPPKKGKDKDFQQIVSLGIYCNAAGIQSAEKLAQKLASQLALKEFDWHEWGKHSKALDSFGYWIKEFEADYFNRRERNEQSQTTWDTDYNHIFKRISPEETLTEESLIQLVLTTDPDTRQRQRAVMVASSLAKFVEVEVDLGRYKGNYSYLKNNNRILPTEEEIIKYYWSIPNPHWQRAFACGRECSQCRASHGQRGFASRAAYGISNHELFYVDLNSLQVSPGHLVSTYRKEHDGVRRIYCLYPEWYEDWKLYEHIDLPKVTGKNNRDLGHRVSKAFRRYGLCKPGDLRHCWAIGFADSTTLRVGGLP